MNRRMFALGLAVLVTFAVGSAWAQAPSVKIGFSFFAVGKSLPSGTYTIEITSAGNVVLKNKDGNVVADMKPVKSLGRNANLSEPKLVFHSAGAVRLLSEVWLPGQDGYLVASMTGPHEEQVVGGQKNSK